MDTKIKAIAYLVLCHLFWSTNNIVGRNLGEHLSPIVITSMRWLIASIVYPAIMGRGSIRGLKSYIGLRSAFLGLLGFAIFNIALYQALALAPSSLVGFAYGFTPIAILVVGTVMSTSSPSSIQILGSILSTIGVSILFTYRGISIGEAKELLGLALGILTGFIWATYTVIQKRIYPEADQISLTYASLLMATTILGLLSAPYIYLESSRISRPEILAQLLWIAILPGALAYYMWNKAVSIVGSASAASFSNLLPVFTAILGHIVLREELGVGDILGGALIISGSAISMYKADLLTTKGKSSR